MLQDVIDLFSAGKARRDQAAIDAITRLAFSAIAAKARARYGWTPAHAERAVDAYRRFLYVVVLNPGTTVVPWNQDLDRIWHEHILDTRRYKADCEALFGRFLHHTPHSATDDPAVNRADRRMTRTHYRRAFRGDARGQPAWFATAPMPGRRRRSSDQGDAQSCSGIGCTGDAGCSSGSGGDGGGCGGD